MAIRHIGAAWKTQLKAFPSYERTYIDFRQYIYPPVNNAPLTYTLIGSADNQPGSHNVTGGHADYLLALPSSLTIFARVLPTFAFDVATDQPLWNWTIDADHYLKCYYKAADDTIHIDWKDGTNARVLLSDVYENNGQLQVWQNIVGTMDLTSASENAGKIYVDEDEKEGAWDDAPDIKSSNFPLFSLRHDSGTEGGWTINQVRVFSNKVAALADVANLFRDLEEEEVVWNLNGEGCGRTRCNVSRLVKSHGIERRVEEPTNGAQGANTFHAMLESHTGEFADDQYAAFDPTAEQFNGTSAQRYLQKQARVELETWYTTTWEPAFIGRVDNNLFARSSVADGKTYVDISAEDGVSDIAREMKRRSRAFASKKLSDATEADSLVHLIARLATSKDVYNYLANSSFENATIGNSWAVSGGTAPTFTKAAGGLFGSNEGQLDYDDATCIVIQTVTCTGTKKLNKGESYNFSIYLKSAGAVNHAASLIKLAEHDSGGSNDDTDALVVLAGGEGWKRFEVTHTITDATSDRLRVTISLGNNVVLSCDGAMLVQGERAPYFWALNNNDGASAVESADDADYASYDTVGFDVDAVDVTHPWVFIPATTSVWDHLKELADATGPMYFGMDACGTIRLRCKLATGYADPSSLETVTAVRSVDSVLELARANKIIGHGVKIEVYTAIQVMWMLEAVPAFVTGGGKPRVSVANAAVFPDQATYGQFFAKYGEVK